MKTLPTVNAGEGVEKRKPSYSVDENVNWYSHDETVWRSFKKLKIELPYDPAIPFLGIYSEKTILEKIHVPLCSQQHYSLISQDTEAT